MFAKSPRIKMQTRRHIAWIEMQLVNWVGYWEETLWINICDI